MDAGYTVGGERTAEKLTFRRAANDHPLEMTGFKDKLTHAFGIEPEYDVEHRGLPEVLERLAREVVSRGMETPAIIVLEAVVPLCFLGSQAMIAAWPLVSLASSSSDYREVADALEDRRTVRAMARRIEELAASGTGPA
jgi:hypothetical protein